MRGLAGERVSPTIADRRAAGEGFHDSDPGAKAENRLGAHLGQHGIGVGQDAELQEADPHGVERTGAGHCFEAGAVISVDKKLRRFQSGAGFHRGKKTPALLGREGGIVIGTGEVSENPGQPQGGGRHDPTIQRRRFLVPNPETAHSGIDLQVHGNRPAGEPGGGFETVHFVRGRDGGRQIGA